MAWWHKVVVPGKGGREERALPVVPLPAFAVSPRDNASRPVPSPAARGYAASGQSELFSLYGPVCRAPRLECLPSSRPVSHSDATARPATAPRGRHALCFTGCPERHPHDGNALHAPQAA